MIVEFLEEGSQCIEMVSVGWVDVVGVGSGEGKQLLQEVRQ